MRREPSPLASPSDIERSRRQGRAQVDRGRARMQESGEVLQELRRRAEQTRAEAEREPEETAYTIMRPPLSLSEAMDEALRPVLFALWEQNYTRIYFAGAYILMDPYGIPHYKRMKDFEADFRTQMRRIDGSRFTTVTNEEPAFVINTRRNRHMIDFPGRDQVMRNFKCALVVAEMLYDERFERAFLSIRGIDLESMQTVVAELGSVVVSDKVRNLYHQLETNSEDPEDKSPLAGMPDAAKELHANLRDRRDFINRLKQAGHNFTFRHEFLGEHDGFEARATSIINKAMLAGKGLEISDSDFLLVALPKADTFDEDGSDGTNAIWRLTPLEASRSERMNFDVEAVSRTFDDEQSVPVGLLQVVSRVP